MSAGRDLAEKHGGVWGEHPEFPLRDWRTEVANDDERQGYWDWVVAKIDESRPFCEVCSVETTADEGGNCGLCGTHLEVTS